MKLQKFFFVDKKISNIIKFSTREITLIGIFLAIAVLLTYIDATIGILHPLHKTFLLIAIFLIGFKRSFILLTLFTLINALAFGGAYFITWEQFPLATLGFYSLLLILLSKKNISPVFLFLNILLIIVIYVFFKASAYGFYPVNNLKYFFKQFSISLIVWNYWIDIVISGLVAYYIILFFHKPLTKTIDRFFIKKYSY